MTKRDIFCHFVSIKKNRISYTALGKESFHITFLFRRLRVNSQNNQAFILKFLISISLFGKRNHARITGFIEKIQQNEMPFVIGQGVFLTVQRNQRPIRGICVPGANNSGALGGLYSSRCKNEGRFDKLKSSLFPGRLNLYSDKVYSAYCLIVSLFITKSYV